MSIIPETLKKSFHIRSLADVCGMNDRFAAGRFDRFDKGECLVIRLSSRNQNDLSCTTIGQPLGGMPSEFAKSTRDQVGAVRIGLQLS